MSHNFKFIPQYKGKDLVKLNKIHRKDKYFTGIKYDGHYIQIHKFGNEVMFFTSGGKSFKLDDVEIELIALNPNIDFIIETEHIGLTSGKLGSRGKCTTTTWFTNYEKFIPCYAGDKQFKAFDVLYYEDNLSIYSCLGNKVLYGVRNLLFDYIQLGSNISLVQFDEMSMEESNNFTDRLCEQGWEGTFNFHSTHVFEETNTSRSNLAIKQKAAPTVDLICTGVNYSDINPEDIASIICMSKDNKIVSAGHLKHELKSKEPEFFIGRVIEVKYESMGVNTYQQPRFSQFRDDKTIGDID